MDLLSIFVILGIICSVGLFFYSHAPKFIISKVKGGWKNDWEVPSTEGVLKVSWIPAVVGVLLGVVASADWLQYILPLSVAVITPPALFATATVLSRRQLGTHEWADLPIALLILGAICNTVVTGILIGLRIVQPAWLIIGNIMTTTGVVFLLYIMIEGPVSLLADKIIEDAWSKYYLPSIIIIACLFIFLARWFWPI